MILWLSPRPVWTAHSIWFYCGMWCRFSWKDGTRLHCLGWGTRQSACMAIGLFQFRNLSIWKLLKLEMPRAFTNSLSTSSSLTSHASKKANLMVRILTLSFYGNNFFLALSSCGHQIRQRCKQSSLRPRGSSKRLLLRFSQCRWTITCWRWGDPII